ncbi:kinase-like domain-containing protein [Rhizophagus diaphanus]|nr:kinase-like domain-containing protein [Rhizophagus diaphanus] [Rhizophagus sp. MUCL 43196]
MVIEYAKEGSLRQYLNNIFNSIKWGDRLKILKRIADGLNSIHEKGLIHRDFHCGNMLKDDDYTINTDLGLCQPANVLRGKEYTQETISICQGLRPKSNYKIPQLILDIIKQCWDAGPSKRPKTNELYDSLDYLHDKLYDADIEIKKQVEEAERIMKTVYTSRLLNYKNLPEPKNAIDNKDEDNSIGEYSESIEAIGFTKLDLGTHLH